MQTKIMQVVRMEQKSEGPQYASHCNFPSLRILLNTTPRNRQGEICGTMVFSYLEFCFL